MKITLSHLKRIIKEEMSPKTSKRVLKLLQQVDMLSVDERQQFVSLLAAQPTRPVGPTGTATVEILKRRAGEYKDQAYVNITIGAGRTKRLDLAYAWVVGPYLREKNVQNINLVVDERRPDDPGWQNEDKKPIKPGTYPVNDFIALLPGKDDLRQPY